MHHPIPPASRPAQEAGGAPALSVVLVTPDVFPTLSETVARLREQANSEQIELVVVGPEAMRSSVPEEAPQGFFNLQVVELAGLEDRCSSGEARALGIRSARAAVVAFLEDHSFPAAGWARALIDQHKGPWTAVGPTMQNMNPESRISWADFLLGYGAWAEPIQAGEVEHLPGHNSSYKRDALHACGSELSTLLEAETVLHWELREKGHRLYLEPAACTVHLNFGSRLPWLRALYYNGRLFAGVRSRNWSLRRRVLYALAGPLIPLVRVFRASRDLARIKSGGTHPPRRGVLLVALCGALADGVGQSAGYALGEGGRARRKLWPLEFHRELYAQPDA